MRTFRNLVGTIALGALAVTLAACSSGPKLEPAAVAKDYQWSTGPLPTGNVLRLPVVEGVRKKAQDIPIVAVLVYDPEDPGRNLPQVYWYFQLPDGRCQRWYVADEHLYYTVCRELRLGPTETPTVAEVSRKQKITQLFQTVKAAPGLRQVKLCDCLSHDERRLNVASVGPKGWQGAQSFTLIGVQGDEAKNAATRTKTLELVRKTNVEAVGKEVYAIEPEMD